MRRYWFDWAASAPPQREEQEAALQEALGFPGNPSSPHREGKEAKAFLEGRRADCARNLGVKAKDLTFTSGGTESNQIVLYSLLLRGKEAALLHGTADHPSVRSAARFLETLGHPVYRHKPLYPASPDGKACDLAYLEDIIVSHSDIRMVSLLMINNETGLVAPIKEAVRCIRRAAGSRGSSLHIHCDAVQALGKIPFDIEDLDIDSLSLSAHKLGGPRGAGLLWCRREFSSIHEGGGQEHGIRGGTENLFGAAGLARALIRSCDKTTLSTQLERVKSLMAGLIEGLPPSLVPFPEDRLPRDGRFSPYIVQLVHDRLPAEVLVRLLDAKGFALATSSACSSKTARREVLEAFGLAPEASQRAFRVSLGPASDENAVKALLDALRTLNGDNA